MGHVRALPLTTLLYVGIFLHALVLMIGGAYTYARVPVGFDLEHLLDRLHDRQIERLTAARRG